MEPRDVSEEVSDGFSSASLAICESSGDSSFRTICAHVPRLKISYKAGEFKALKGRTKYQLPSTHRTHAGLAQSLPLSRENRKSSHRKPRLSSVRLTMESIKSCTSSSPEESPRVNGRVNSPEMIIKYICINTPRQQHESASNPVASWFFLKKL